MDDRDKNHHRSKSLNMQTLNKEFSELYVQSDVKHEKTSIEKINEIILGSEKYFIPERPALKINTKAQEKKCFKTPVSEVDFNELLRSLDDLTNVVKSNKNKIHKEAIKPESDEKKEEKKVEEKVEDKKVEEEKIEEMEKIEEKENIEEKEKIEEEKIEDVDIENINKTIEQNLNNSTNIIENNEVIENKENSEITRSEGMECINKNEKFKVPELKIINNSKELPEITVNKQIEIVKNESEIGEENNSRIIDNNNKNTINLYSKNRGSINIDIYMNPEEFPNTPVTPITPDLPEQNISIVQNVNEVNEVNKDINEEINKEINEEANEETNMGVNKDDIPLPPELSKFKYSHRKSNSEVNVPTGKLNTLVRRTNSKDKLDILKKEYDKPYFEGNTNMEYSLKNDGYDENELEEEEIESNPARQDSMSYSKAHILNNGDRNKSFLNQKNSKSNNLHKKTSQNRLSLNRSSINFQDAQNVNDLSNPPTSFSNDNKSVTNTGTINDEKGKDIYYIQHLNREDESNLVQEQDNNIAGTFNRDSNVNDNELNNENNEKLNVPSDDENKKEKVKNNIEVMKFDVHSRDCETKEETKKEEGNVLMTNRTKVNNQHNTYHDEEKKGNEQENPDHNIYVASPGRVKYQSAVIYSKRNSSLTKFSLGNPRTGNVAGTNVSTKSKYYRYSMARNIQTYHNVADKGPVPSHHTKLTIPHFNPNIIPEQPEQTQEQQIYKESLESDSSQSTLLMEGTTETNKVKTIFNNSNNNNNENYNNNNNNDNNYNDNDNSNDYNMKNSFLFRNNGENNKSHNISNIKSEIEHIEEETNEFPNEFTNDESHFNIKSIDSYPISVSNSVPINMSSVLYDSVENDYHRNKQNNLQNKFKNSKNQPEIIKTINSSTIPFIFSKEHSDWDTNMHTMSLYDEDNPKPKKNRKGFRKTFSIFKKKN